MKNILALILLLLGSSFARAATYYACSAGNVNGSIWYTSTACTSPTTLPTLNNGDILESNNFAVALNAALGSSGTVITLQNTLAGGFTYATASNLTFYVNANCTSTTASDYTISVSGSTGGGSFLGTMTGGTVSTCYALYSNQTSVNVTVLNATGGASAPAVYLHSTGTVTFTGLAQPAASYGVVVANAGGAIFSGSIYGSNSGTVPGCQANTGSGGCQINGATVWNGTKAAAIGGPVYVTGASAFIYPATTSYVIGTMDANAYVAVSDPGTTNVRSGVAYLPGRTGSYGGSCTAAVSTGCW